MSVVARMLVFNETPAPKPDASNATRSLASIWFRASSLITLASLASSVAIRSASPTLIKVVRLKFVVLPTPAPLTRALAAPSKLADLPLHSGLAMVLRASTSRVFALITTPLAIPAVILDVTVWLVLAPAPEIKPDALARWRALKVAVCVASRLNCPLPRLLRSMVRPLLPVFSSATTVLVFVVLACTEAPAPSPPAPATVEVMFSSLPWALTDSPPPVS